MEHSLPSFDFALGWGKPSVPCLGARGLKWYTKGVSHALLEDPHLHVCTMYIVDFERVDSRVTPAPTLIANP